ncbi:MAG: MGMT family protein [Anaerolineae bacterium]|nr:MGMT family protein [Anaerolineae bacterium]
MSQTLFDKIYWIVQRIPPGRVATYGQIARLVGIPRGARTVGWALHSLPDDVEVPWQRVINAQGRVSTGWEGDESSDQRALLEVEGVVFDEQGRVDLKAYGWVGLDLAEWQQLHEAEADAPHLPD